MSIYEDLLREMVPADDPLYETLVRFNEKILPDQMPKYPETLDATPQTPADKVELNRAYGKLARNIEHEERTIIPTEILPPDEAPPVQQYLRWVSFYSVDFNSPYPKELTRKGRVRRWFRNYLYEHWGVR